MGARVPNAATRAEMTRPRLGISACLLGQPVRYDGGHKWDRFLTDTVGRFVEWVPVCPEAECGLPVPRESMHLEGDPENPRLISSRTRVDHTDRMLAWARKRLAELERDDLCGFIFKANSPSCGVSRVRVCDVDGRERKVGCGLFARAFMDRFLLVPVEDDGRLHDVQVRENFIENVFCLSRYRSFREGRATLARLIEFHSDHKVQIMAHSPKHLAEMGRLLAGADGQEPGGVLAAYERLLTEALRLRATPAKNANALMHTLGFLNDRLSAEEKAELIEAIRDYRAELVPLIVPLTLMRHYVRKYDEPYLKRQSYLNPHPVELKLRNHA